MTSESNYDIAIHLEQTDRYATRMLNTFEIVGAAWRAKEAACLERVTNHAAWLELDQIEQRIDELRGEDERLQWLRYWLRVASWRED